MANEYRTVKRFPAKISRWIFDEYKEGKYCLVCETESHEGEIFKTQMYVHTPPALERTMKTLARLKFYGGLRDLLSENGGGTLGIPVTVAVVKVIPEDPRGKTYTNYEIYPPEREAKPVQDLSVLDQYDWGKIPKPTDPLAANEGMPDVGGADAAPYDWDGNGPQG
jgi:hypothetical protein